MRDFQRPGRSPVRATGGMAATSHPLATQAAVAMLQAGGNAVDAAITAAAVQAVVEPQSTGIGGDCFVLYAPAGSSKVIALNGSGRAAAAADIAAYRAMGLDRVPTQGVHSVTLPGAVDAWARLLADHGRKTMAEVLAPAIAYAEQGYVVHDRVAFDWREEVELLSADADTAAIFLPGGKAPQPGDLHRQPALGRTLRTIAKQGREGFYAGPVAAAMTARLRALGGLHTEDDFANTRCDYVTPVATSYRGYEVVQMPPNNQGMTALVMLNILSGDDLAALDPDGTARLHLEVEAARLAYNERNTRLGDLSPADPVIPALLSPAHAAKLRACIQADRAMDDLPMPELAMSDTVYISIVDADRNAISFINSTYYAFGAGIACPETGVIFQNRGASFRLDPAHPNALAPGKRPLHTIMPGMLMRDGRAVMPFGVMGGDYQPVGHVHLLTNLLDHGMDVQAALDAPRVFWRNGVIEAERGIPADTVAGLIALGHRVIEAPEPLGGGQAIWIDHDRGTLTGGSDPRKDGMAAGY
jgi:gamma-glutamyltranspeptidase/glutathione hydrolase